MWLYIAKQALQCTNFCIRMCFSRTSLTAKERPHCQHTPYCLFAIKSFDLEGWAKKIIAFPEGVEPSCCHAATSERRRIRLKADYYYIALRGASIRRSQRGNSEAVFFRGTLPRRYSIRRSQRDNNSATRGYGNAFAVW